MLQCNSSVSTNSDLEEIIGSLNQTIPKIESTMSMDNVVNCAMIRTMIEVGNILLKGESILLPTVHDIFNQHARCILKTINVEYNASVTSRWLLSQLITHLKHHVSFVCKVRKHGTIIKNQDHLLTLSHLLWKQRNDNNMSNTASAPLSSNCNPVTSDHTP